MEILLKDKFCGIQHIGIPVSDVKASESFYNKLGFDTMMRSQFLHKGNTGEVIMVQRDSVILELYQMPEPDLSEIKEKSDGHIDHIAFDIKDIDKVYIELKDAGFNIIEDEPIFLNFWDKGCKYINVLGPDNERLEFNERL